MQFISNSFLSLASKRASAITLSLALLAAGVSSALPHIAHAEKTSISTSELVALTNADRAEAGLGELTVNKKLVAAAQAKADNMAKNGYFAHQNPDGTDSWHWFRLAGYNYIRAGENLAVNFSEAEDVEEAWMNSPTHRANIMNGKYTEVGIAAAVGTYKGKKTIFVAQMFGTPSGSSEKTAKVSSIPTREKPTRVLGATAESVTRADLERQLRQLTAMLAELQKKANRS